jgi:predicted PurR-regulated permease PerM
MTHFAHRVVVAVLITAVILAIAYLLWRGVYVLLEAFAGVLLALFLAALADRVSKYTRLSYRWSLAAVVLGLFLIGGGLSYFLWSRLSAQVSEMIPTLHRSLEQIKAYLTQYGWGQYLVEKAPQAASGLAQASELSRLTGFVSGVAGFLEAGLVILIVGIFGAAEPDVYKAGLLHLVPPGNRRRVAEAVDAITFNLRHWLVGQVLLMVIIGITTAIGLGLIGVPLALTLGILAGILELVPYIGPWISAVPAAMIALLKGPEYLMYTLALYLLLHLLEGYVLLPLIQRRAVHLPPALTLVAQVLMGQMLGLLGLFVAAPLTVAAMVLLKMLYVEDTLGDEAVNVPGEPGNELKQAAERK